MELNWTMFLIVCPLVFLAGFVDSIAGGGGLISLPAYMLAGLPAHTAVATNKLSSCIGTFFSTARYCMSGCVDWLLAVPSIILAVIGAQIGSRLALLVPDTVFKWLLMILLPVIAVYVLTRKSLEPKEGTAPMERKWQFITVSFFSLLIGTYDGFYGPGTGTFMTLVFTGICRMKVLKAAGNVKLANLASNLSALVTFLIQGLTLLPLGLAAAVFSIAGHWLGSGMAIKKGAGLVRWVILGVLVLLFLRLVLEAVGVL